MSYRDWLISQLSNSEKNEEINSATALGDSLIEILTGNGKTVIIGVIDSVNITVSDVSEIYTSGPKKPNLVIAKSDAIWNGSAIDYSRQKNMGWGGIGQISSTFQTNDYAAIQRGEYTFVEEGLLKHTRVARLERIYDRVFKIHRKGNLPPLTIALINSYELSGDEVRHAISKYGRFDAILKTNPNGSPTGNAHSAAAEIGAAIFIWRQLLSRLNKR
ncbi:hypothetical protein ACFJIV_29100 [Mucilaginibacter sp. UC70_90]